MQMTQVKMSKRKEVMKKIMKARKRSSKSQSALLSGNESKVMNLMMKVWGMETKKAKNQEVKKRC